MAGCRLPTAGVAGANLAGQSIGYDLIREIVVHASISEQ
jgi:hypothetical protein